MKNKFNSKASGSLTTAVLFGMIAAYIAVFLLLLLSAFVLLMADLGNNAVGIAATVSLSVSGAVCGFVAAKKLGNNALITGLISGAVFYLSVTVIALLISGGGLSSLFIIRFILTVSMSGVGAFLSTSKKRNKSFI